MIKYAALITTVVILALAAPGKPVVSSGSWRVDSRHSDVQLATDATTNFGKTKTTFTVGFARATGIVKLDSANPTKSEFHVDFYPATSMNPTIDHEGNVSIAWFGSGANNTMICFHSKSVEQTSDGRLKATGTLGVTRVDRNITLDANEAYSGPVYGPPTLHQDAKPATFVFDAPAAASTGAHKGSLETFGSYSLTREDFPQFFRTVLAIQWPALVRDKHCQTTGAGEAYAGAECTGDFLQPTYPLGPAASASEDYPGPQNFNSIVGQHMTISAHLHLTPTAGKASNGN
jgi:polyisoprenoid-binding protein YceI